MNICAITDEISRDFKRAIHIGLDYGINTFELRTIYGKRFPFYDEDDIELLILLKKEYGFHISSIIPGIYKIGVQQTPWEQLKQIGYSEILKMAKELQCSNFIVFGTKPNPNEIEYRAMIENIKKFSIRVANHNFGVLLENSSSSYCNNSKKLIEVAKAVSDPGIGIAWNPCDCFYSDCLDIDKDYKKLKPFIQNVYLKDMVTVSGGDKEFVPLGEGEIDLHKILMILKSNGYTGNITIETNCTYSETAFIKSVGYIKEIIGII